MFKSSNNKEVFEMISEVLIMMDHKVSSYPFMFIKKHNKIVFKKLNSIVFDVEEALLKMLNNFSKFSDKLSLVLQTELSENFKDSVSKIQNIEFSENPSESMQVHVKNFYNDENYVNLGEFSQSGLSFIAVKIKNKQRIVEKLYFNRYDEDYNRFVSRVLSHVRAFTKKKLDFPVRFSNKETMENYKNFKWAKKVQVKQYALFDFNVNEYISKNEKEIENRIKSESYNQELKEKYSVNYEDVKKYKNPIIVYPDGAVFPNGRSGIGVVFVENDQVLNFFGKSTDFGISANECESIAIYETLIYAKQHLPFHTDYLEIRTDSLNCIRNIDEGNDVDNTMKIKDLLEEITWLDIKICWNKGHSGIFHNEMADIIAKNICLSEND